MWVSNIFNQNLIIVYPIAVVIEHSTEIPIYLGLLQKSLNPRLFSSDYTHYEYEYIYLYEYTYISVSQLGLTIE